MSLTKLCGLFQRSDKRGDLYLTGALGLGKITINRNLYKQKPGEPDFYLCIIPNAESGPKAPGDKQVNNRGGQ